MPAPPVNVSLKDSLNDTSSATGGTILGAPVNFAPRDSVSDKVIIGVVSSLAAVMLLGVFKRKGGG